ncbi:hypothetical protein B0G77_0373 [Paraburkholderia sp. BL10I2N1]|nr:hypothetical protein B0G77_0373 [Paraburkholderia sp. BL10I2N1]
MLFECVRGKASRPLDFLAKIVVPYAPPPCPAVALDANVRPDARAFLPFF